VILPEIISKEPHSPVVRHGDDQWFDIVRWTLFALLTAEELGVTQANLEESLRSDNPEIRRLLGLSGDHGPLMGLDRRWAYNIVRAVGNYGEVFERNLGQGSPIKLRRGLNDLYTRGGLMYAPPIR
jgi:general L-amino acid transport system substrate-binding protein